MSDYKVISTVAAADIKIISNIAVADIRSVTGDAKQPSSGFEGLYALDNIEKFTSINNMNYGSRTSGWKGPWVGIGKAALDPTYSWKSACRSVAEISGEVGGTAYVQWKNDLGYNTAWNLLVGLGYVDDDNCGGVDPRDWLTWTWELIAGGTKAWCGTCVGPVPPAGATAGYEMVDNSQNWTNGVTANNTNYRTCRLEVNSGVVSWKYSDDAEVSWTTMYTSPRTVDIAGNSNLVACVAVKAPHGYGGTPENLKLYGKLENT